VKCPGASLSAALLRSSHSKLFIKVAVLEELLPAEAVEFLPVVFEDPLLGLNEKI
jgi:hypothetical protein